MNSCSPSLIFLLPFVSYCSAEKSNMLASDTWSSIRIYFTKSSDSRKFAYYGPPLSGHKDEECKYLYGATLRPTLQRSRAVLCA
jgi:hypothetical protein